jgi:hypothetical protein
MKKILTLFLLMAFSAAGFAQEKAPVQMKTKEELLQKSKNQKTTGFIMLGAGAAAAAAGYALFWNDFNLYDENSGNGGAILGIAGGLSMVGSIFFFVASGNNKREANAMTASFKMEKGVPPMLRDIGPTYYPAFSLKFNIR